MTFRSAEGRNVVATMDSRIKTRSVLIVDDEPDIRDLYRFAFEEEGFRVDEAADGLEGVEQAKQIQPDLVVLDIAMPRLDGLAALPRILAAAPDAKVVIVTAYSTVEAFATGRRLGACACYQKERFVPAISEVWDRYCA